MFFVHCGNAAETWLNGVQATYEGGRCEAESLVGANQTAAGGGV